jgi:hypothetical protein
MELNTMSTRITDIVPIIIPRTARAAPRFDVSLAIFDNPSAPIIIAANPNGIPRMNKLAIPKMKESILLGSIDVGGWLDDRLAGIGCAGFVSS